ncbi:SAM-dependent DNA methyltransferase [Priestia megaterium]|uniref:SAM-dependent DNA methyltransferase n=1 Tax=Priestia megaterium TaxID=1404 RepID=UPI002E247E5A|nr:SAM-dependent DNA methyltransferase [Priestia megaterium]
MAIRRDDLPKDAAELFKKWETMGTKFKVPKDNQEPMEKISTTTLGEQMRLAQEKVENLDPKSKRELLEAVKQKTPLYRIEMFSPEELMEAMKTIGEWALANGGAPQSPKEALEKRGWLFPYLMGYDQLATGRWNYWIDILEKNTLEGSGPIPQIEWSHDRNSIHQVRKMLFNCIDGVWHEGVGPNEFADWLLWGLGAADEPPKISDKVSEHWYRTFDLALVLLHPTDYLSGLLEDLSSKGHKQALGYFSTPMDVTTMMAEMVVGNHENREEMKTKTVNEPCVGCGAMLLPMSNYTLFGCGQDINPVAVKFCIIQMYWYAPWYAKNPFHK